MKMYFRIGIISTLILMLIIPTGCKTAKFELSSLEINPNKVAIGDTAIVSVDLANVGNAEGTYSVTLSLDGTILETINVTMPAESVRKVRFDVVKEETGVYTIEIGELSGQLEVVKPAEFKLSSLVVTPSEVLPGEEVTVTVDISNTGGLEGDYTCTLIVNADVQENKVITLDSQARETVTFKFTPSYAGGRCNIEIGELTEKIKTFRPTDILVEDVSVSTRVVEVGSSVTINVEIRNYGDVEGSHTVTLELNYEESVGAQSINVGGGETETLQFIVTENDIGRHQIRVDGKYGSFTVIPEAPTGYKSYTGYTNTWNEFFVIYPEGWRDYDVESACCAFIGPIQNDGIFPDFVVTGEALSFEMTVQECFEIYRDQNQYYEDYEEVSTEEITVNGVFAIKHTFTLTIDRISCTLAQVYLITNESAYILTLGSSTKDYPNFTETFDNLINSFQLLPRLY